MKMMYDRRLFAISLLLGSLLIIGKNGSVVYAQSTLEALHHTVQADMEDEEPLLFPPVEILWRGTLQRSPTLQLALQKMSKKMSGKNTTDRSLWTGQFLQNILQIGGMGSSVMLGNPAPMIGGTMLGHMTAPDETSKRLTATTSADLVILSRDIEEAQGQLITNYLQYSQAKVHVAYLQSMLDRFSQDQTQNSASHVQESTHLSDMFPTLIHDQTFRLKEAQDTVQTYRNLLVLSSGEEAVAAMEQWRDKEKTQQRNGVQPQ